MLVGKAPRENLVRVGLRSKFILAFALQTMIVALLIVGIQQWRVRKAIIHQTVEQGMAIANSIQSTAGYYVLFGLTDDLKKIVDDIGRNPSVSYADFVNADG